MLRTVSAKRWFVPAVALFAWLSLLALLIPHDPDEAVYSAIARGIFDGKWPYRDLFDHKPPVVYFWYLPAGLGANITIERIIAAAVIALSVIPFSSLASRWLVPAQARMAVVAYALLLANPFLDIGANAEAFMLLPLLGSFAVATPVYAGLLFGVVLMTKPVAIAFLPVILMIWRRSSPVVGIGATAAVAALALPFVPIWRDFWDANVTFNVRYGSYTDRSFFDFLKLDPSVMAAALPIWLVAIAQLFKSPPKIVLVMAVSSVVCVKLTGYVWPHYHMLLVPPFALLAGIGLQRLKDENRRPRLLLGAGVFSAIVLLSGMGFLISRIGREEAAITAIKREQGEFYMLGARSQMYADAGRWPERKYFFSVPLVVDEAIGSRVREDLLACPPAVLVIPEHTLFQVKWKDDVTALYADRDEYKTGTLYTDPYIGCEPN